jgi:3-oxoadipate enol-lactonase/4-carboxymuconolactone decarboxylase
MPFLTINQTRLFYRLEGRDGMPVLILSHSLGCDHGMWEPQIQDLLPYFQVLRYDTRGHGASDAPSGNYTLEQLGRDVLALADGLKISKFSFCGVSMGGAIGQWLAINAPERLNKLVLSNTSPKFGSVELWETRMKAVREGSMKAIVDTSMQRFFSPEMEMDPQVQSVRSVFLGTDPTGYLGCCAALRDTDLRGQLDKIHVPTLIIGGDNDPSTPWEGNGDILAREISGAAVMRLPTAHLSNLGRPRSFTAALLEFLPAKLPYEDPLPVGMGIRREVLGGQHVTRSMDTATEFTRDFQLLITRYAWGTIWARPGLDRRTRRLLALAIMAALGRWEEFRLHFRAAFTHRIEPCDLKETLLQVAIYAGLPAANTAFKIASEEMEKPEN